MFLKSFNLFKRGQAARRTAAASASSTFRARKDLKLADLRNWDELASLAGADLGPGFKAQTFEVSETNKGIELAIELPGFESGDVDIDLADGMLTLKAETNGTREESDNTERTQRVTRFSQSVEHRFRLPFEAGGAGAQATFEDGRLKIFVPRSSDAQQGESTKIEISMA